MKINRPLHLAFLIASLSLPAAPVESIAQDEKKAGSEERGKEKGGRKGRKGGPKIAKPRINDTVKATIYADNWFKLYLNGNLVAVDSISFIPHNVVSVDILPDYPI